MSGPRFKPGDMVRLLKSSTRHSSFPDSMKRAICRVVWCGPDAVQLEIVSYEQCRNPTVAAATCPKSEYIRCPVSEVEPYQPPITSPAQITPLRPQVSGIAGDFRMR